MAGHPPLREMGFGGVPSLLVTHGYHFGIRFELQDLVTLGRSSGCNIQLLDEKVSRLHATIYAEADGFHLRDEGSSNGSGLNGELLLEPARLSPGDEIAIGNNLLLFEPSLDILRDRGAGGAVVLASAGDAELISEVGVSGLSSADGLPFQPAGLMAAVARVLASSRNAGFAWLILEALVRGIGAERAAMIRIRGPGRPMQALLTYPSQNRVTVPRSLLDKVLEQGKGLRMEDTISDLKIRGGRTRIESRLGSALCLPVIRRGRIEAVLYLDTQVRGAFRSLPLSVVEDLAILCHPVILTSLGLPQADERSAAAEEPPPVADSPAMQRVLANVDQLDDDDLPVLLVGERGSGRRAIARYIHDRSERCGGGFSYVGCDELAEEELERELFGHEKGAFPGALSRGKGRLERADCGTVVLGEIGDLSPSMQTKVLRVIQEKRLFRQGAVRPVSSDVRIIGTSRRDLAHLVRGERFREDLYHTLERQRIDVPALRERAADMVPLVRAEIDAFNFDAGAAVSGLAAEALDALQAHPWHGNLAELRQVMRRVLVLTRGTEVQGDVVRDVLAVQADPAGVDDADGQAAAMRDLERHLLLAAAQRSEGRKTRAARILGIDRAELDRRLLQYGVDLSSEFADTMS